MDVTRADEAFKSLMTRTECLMNEISHNDRNSFKNISPAALEELSLNYIKQASIDSPFNPDNIHLISGQRFPDIVAETFYGVEVKSTNKDHWTSTGSSIIESTRQDLVERIYMLFGKLGGEIAEFRCRPFQDVLSEIAVTHSPRYLIDMRLNEGETIFDKMGVEYDSFRTSPESIDIVRKYYREKARKENRYEMPWWITMQDEAHSFNIRIWNSIPAHEKLHLRALCLILFPELLTPKSSWTKYNNASLWLCSRYQIVHPNIRDVFSAGGRITTADGVELMRPVSKIYRTIVSSAPMIKHILSCPDDDLVKQISEFNPKLLSDGLDLYDNWVEMCDMIARNDNVSQLRYWIENNSVLE